jgi:hypothetical protein
MKKQVPYSILLMAMFIIGFLGVRAQTPTYNCALRNDSMTTASIYEFDIYLLQTGTNIFEYSSGQYGIVLNSAIKSGTVTAKLVAVNGLAYANYNAAISAGTTLLTDLPANNQPNTITFATATNVIKISGKTPTAGCFISNTGIGTRVARIRVETTTSFLQAQPNPTWSFTVNPYNTTISAYIAGVNTVVISSGTFITSNLFNPLLNGSITAFNVTGGGSYCQGGTGLPVGTDGSQTGGVKYLLYKGVTPQGSWITGTGIALAFGNQLAETYTVKAHRTATYMFLNMTGSAIISQLTQVTPSVTIAASANPVFAGTQVTFTPTPVNGGSPTYEWFVNNISVGTGATYAYFPLNGDVVKTVMTSSFSCVTSPTATSSPVTMTVNPIWTGAVSSDWTNSQNWLPLSAPTSSLNAYIPLSAVNKPVITQGPGSPVICNNLTIESGASVTVAVSGALTVNGILTKGAGNADLVVESGGSLIQNSAVTGTVKRFVGNWMAGPEKGWHFLSSPVSNQVISPAFANASTPDNDFYAWWEPTNEWINFKNTTQAPVWNTANVLNGINGLGNFIPGKGYLIAYEIAATKQFTGTLNTADFNISGLVTTGGIFHGWHLLGNPFSSAIVWNNGSWALSNIDALAKIWNETGASYTTINPSEIIPATQGFMVYVPSGIGSLTIPSTARTHSATPWYKASANPYIKLVAHAYEAQTFQESIVSFDSQATPGYDGDLDSYFLQGYAPQFFSMAGDAQLSNNTLPVLLENQTTIPFSFIKTGETNYTIEAEQIDNVPTQVYLTDLKLNHTQNLLTNPVYTFSSADGDDPARFLLSFSHVNVGTGENSLNNHSVYTFENNLFLVNPGKARLEVFNLTGQKLLTREINFPGIYKTTLSVPTAYYMVRLTTGTKVIVTRVFIKS